MDGRIGMPETHRLVVVTYNLERTSGHWVLVESDDELPPRNAEAGLPTSNTADFGWIEIRFTGAPKSWLDEPTIRNFMPYIRDPVSVSVTKFPGRIHVELWRDGYGPPVGRDIAGEGCAVYVCWSRTGVEAFSAASA